MNKSQQKIILERKFDWKNKQGEFTTIIDIYSISKSTDKDNLFVEIRSFCTKGPKEYEGATVLHSRLGLREETAKHLLGILKDWFNQEKDFDLSGYIKRLEKQKEVKK